MGLVLIKFILPAITSASFIAPAVIATKKKLYSAAFLFAFTTFFQIFHHLCTTPGLSLLFCLMGDKLLKYFATYGIVISAYVTIIHLTRFSTERRYNLCTSGGLLTAVRIYQTTDGYGVYSAPLSFASLLLALSWGQEMWRSKSLYPDKDSWIKIILPGLTLGGISLILRFVLQNSWNFMIVHSLHHITMAASIAILLKLAQDGEGIDTKNSKCGCLTACCFC